MLVEHESAVQMLDAMEEHDCGSNRWMAADNPGHRFDSEDSEEDKDEDEDEDEYRPVIGHICIGCEEYHIIRLSNVRRTAIRDGMMDDERWALFKERDGRRLLAERLSALPPVVHEESKPVMETVAGMVAEAVDNAHSCLFGCTPNKPHDECLEHGPFAGALEDGEPEESEWADYPCICMPACPDDPFDRRVWHAMREIMDEVTDVFGDRCNVYAETVTQLHRWVRRREAMLEAPERYWVMVHTATGNGKVKDTAGSADDSEIKVTGPPYG